MSLRIDFTRLTLVGALDLAVAIEEEAQLRYQGLAARAGDPGAAAFFREMAVSEARHRRQLEARRQVHLRHAPPRMETSLLDDVEAADPDGLPAAAPLRDAVAAALAAEERAWRFYDEALPHVGDPEVRAFFAELRDEELEHQALLRERLARLDR